MKPQKALTSSLSALFLFAIIMAPLNSSEATIIGVKHISAFQQEKIENGSSKTGVNSSAQIPGKISNHQDKQKTEDKQGNKGDHEQPKTRHHADEEKHKNHLYHYSRIRHKRKTVESMMCICLKFFVAISYIAILLSTYMHLGH